MQWLTTREQARARNHRAEAQARRREQRMVPPGRPLLVAPDAIPRRKELVTQLSLYYEFLKTLYLPDNCAKYPPKGGDGWSFITAERLAFMGKTDAVIDVLKHIPYITQDLAALNSERFQIFEKTVCNDYTGASFENGIKHQNKDEVDPFPEMLEGDFVTKHLWDGRLKDMQHIVTLARSKSRNGHWLMYDTRDGQLACIDFQDGNDGSDTPKVLLEQLKECFRSLDVFPTEPTNVRIVDMQPYSAAQIDEVKAVFKKYGWGTASFEKDRCMAEVKRLWMSIIKQAL